MQKPFNRNRTNHIHRHIFSPRMRMTPLAIALLTLSAPLYANAAETELPAVNVVAEKENSALPSYRAYVGSSGALGTKELLDTPFSISVATKEYIANQQATSISDAFKGDASVTALNNNISGESAQIAIRGLALDTLNGFKIDGLNAVMWQTDLPLEHFEQIEILKGLSGFMYGFSSPGGIANYQTKRATKTPVTDATISYGTQSQYKVAADISRRFGENDRYGLRVNAVHEGGDTYLDAPIKRDSISAAFDVQITPDLVWTLDGLYQRRKVHGSIFSLTLAKDVAMPGPVDGSRRLSQDFTTHETTMATVGTEVKWSFAPDWDMRVGLRSMRQTRTTYDSALRVVDNSGNYNETLYRWYSTQDSDSANLLFTGKLQTGSIGHTLTFGADMQQVERGNGDFSDDFLGVGNFNRQTSFPNPGLAVDKDHVLKRSDTRNIGVFMSDTIQWTPQWSSIIGLRYSKFRQRAYVKGVVDTTYDKTALSPTLAMIWKPEASVSYYTSYVESLQQGGVAPLGTENYEQTFAPLKSKQYEIGVKKEGQGWSAEAALFRIERGLEFTNSNNIFEQSGALTYQGLDIAGRIELGRDWGLMASAVLMNSKNKSDDPEVDGKRANNVANFTAALQAEYKVPGVTGLTLSGGTRYVGKQALESNNAHIIGSYQLFDVGARYKTKVGGKDVTFRANLDNLANEKYWLGSWNGFLVQGAPRTLRASAEFSF
ncbi:TonB-dependent siderophore receptor [Glaciimonas sp. GG7]